MHRAGLLWLSAYILAASANPVGPLPGILNPIISSVTSAVTSATGGASPSLPTPNIIPGSLALPGVPGLPGTPGLPGAPSFPVLPGAPSVPGLPAAPSVPGLPGAPNLSGAPNLPGAPAVPGAPGLPGAPALPVVSPVPDSAVLIGAVPGFGTPGIPPVPGVPGGVVSGVEAPTLPGVPGAPTDLPSIPGVPTGVDVGALPSPALPAVSAVSDPPPLIYLLCPSQRPKANWLSQRRSTPDTAFTWSTFSRNLPVPAPAVGSLPSVPDLPIPAGAADDLASAVEVLKVVISSSGRASKMAAWGCQASLALASGSAPTFTRCSCAWPAT